MRFTFPSELLIVQVSDSLRLHVEVIPMTPLQKPQSRWVVKREMGERLALSLHGSAASGERSG